MHPQKSFRTFIAGHNISTLPIFSLSGKPRRSRTTVASHVTHAKYVTWQEKRAGHNRPNPSFWHIAMKLPHRIPMQLFARCRSENPIICAMFNPTIHRGISDETRHTIIFPRIHHRIRYLPKVFYPWRQNRVVKLVQIPASPLTAEVHIDIDNSHHEHIQLLVRLFCSRQHLAIYHDVFRKYQMDQIPIPERK